MLAALHSRSRSVRSYIFLAGRNLFALVAVGFHVAQVMAQKTVLIDRAKRSLLSSC